jgi:dUTP pyrophosphatase
MSIEVRIVNHSVFALPSYATTGSAGMDLRANTEQVIHLKPLERTLVPTGLFIELPEGYEAQIRPRSGLAIKQGITCLNTPGTIDADYRGEIKVILINLSQEIQDIKPGDRIAQMVVQKVEQVQWEQVDILSTTERDAGGFGHTGKS